MPEAIRLTGRFTRLNEAFLREKANSDDARARFYQAMLSTTNYDEYYKLAGPEVSVATYRTGPVTADMEIKYARRKGWIEDC